MNCRWDNLDVSYSEEKRCFSIASILFREKHPLGLILYSNIEQAWVMHWTGYRGFTHGEIGEVFTFLKWLNDFTYDRDGRSLELAVSYLKGLPK